MQLKDGEAYGFLGANGAGKATLAKKDRRNEGGAKTVPLFTFSKLQLLQRNNKSEPMAGWHQVRIMLMWWTRRESNPCPKSDPREYLRVQLVYNIPFAPGRQTGRRISSFMRSWPPAKLEAAHVQCLNDALAPHGT